MIAEVVSGFMGVWCALLGRWACQATKHGRTVSIVFLAVVAGAAIWTLIFFVGRSV
jgi:hypothetical protein